MQKLKETIVISIIAFALIVFVKTSLSALLYSPQEEIVPFSGKNTTLIAPTALQPSHLIIPSLNIDAEVQAVGLNSKGNMMNPTNYVDVGWYQYGFAPGEGGSAVIAGHLDNGLGLDAVFKNLKKIRKGDPIYTTSKSGEKLLFVVSRIESYPYKTAPVDLIFKQTGSPKLNIITCDGQWSSEDETYTHRLVVFADFVSKESTSSQS